MFSRKKEEPAKKRRPNAGGGLSQYGLMDVDINVNAMGVDDGDDDDDFEAELLALTSGNSPRKPKRAPPPAAKAANLDSMIAASLRDIPSDEDLSGDDDDPDLLNELSALNADEEEPPQPTEPVRPPATSGGSLVTILSDRLKMYQEAETNAKSAGETTRARRFSRGIKTLNDLLKAAKAGRPVNEEDIPPPVATSSGNKPVDPAPESRGIESEPDRVISTPTRPAPLPPQRPSPPPIQEPSTPSPDIPSSSVEIDNEALRVLTERRDEYKRAALVAKKTGDTEVALKYVKIARQFEPVIAAVQAGQPVDLSKMPSSPGESEPSTLSTAPVASPQVEQSENQTSEPDPEPMPESELYVAPPAPTTVSEALDQRLAKYRSVQAEAQQEGNASKARRIGRIVKQYEDAVKLHRAGKPVPVEDLPTPPGFGPIPQEGASLPAPAPAPRAPSPRPPVAGPSAPAPPPRNKVVPATPPKPASPAVEKANVRKSPQSRQEKQLSLLLSRQKEFKEAALEAKKNGEISQAKEYLRLSKGFDPLILASQSGLPVDMDTMPVPPGASLSLSSDFEMVTAEECLPGTDSEIFEKLETDLLKQAKMCLTTRDHFKAIGDVASANRFEQLAVHAKKDLDTLRYAHRRSEPVPKFHYENKSFSIVQCCTDLGDNDLELTIVQGINFTVPNPKEVDTYVKFEFPFPTEEPPKDRTPLVKDTNNPEYNATFSLQIQRNSRCQRVFKRHSIKLEVWSRGSILERIRSVCCWPDAESSKKTQERGFFRSDTLLGTAMVKLMPLETKCELHDSYDLLDGRKPVGGKLEVKVRIRNPMVTKQVEQVNERWLVIDRIA